jgi:uncharacterized protein (TIGR02145 family)
MTLTGKMYKMFTLAVAVTASVLTLFIACDGFWGPIGPSGNQFNPNITYGSFRDPRDDRSYRTVRIGDQTWMAENLNFNAVGSVCYNNKDVNCVKYGRLYRWNIAMTACPAGWHLPSDTDWETLINFVGSDAGTKLKSRVGWGRHNGTDDFGFSALPGGNGNIWHGSFDAVGGWGYWWSASGTARFLRMGWTNGDVVWNDNYTTFQFSLRCLQD